MTAHTKKHDIDDSDEHTGVTTGTENGLVVFDATGLPKEPTTDIAVGQKLTTLTDGSTGTQDASSVKQMEDYVAATVQAMVSKDNVDIATTEALPANTRTADVLTADANGAFPTIDGIAAALNQEYLVKDEGGGASHINNGIYTLTTLGDAGTPWALTRRADLDDGDSSAGAYLAVEQGTVNGDATFRCINNTGSDVVNTDALEFKYWGETTDHGNLLGLSDDDHTQYHNNTRGDARYYTETELDAGQLDNRYFTETEHINESAGAGDAGKPIKLDAVGHVDATMINDADISHDNIADQRYSGAYALHSNPNVTLAGATPLRSDISGWASGSHGVGVGTDGSRWFIAKKDADNAYTVELSAFDPIS